MNNDESLDSDIDAEDLEDYLWINTDVIKETPNAFEQTENLKLIVQLNYRAFNWISKYAIIVLLILKFILT